MACSNCNSNNTVTIGAKQYCTNCGAMVGAGVAPAAKPMSDVTAPASSNVAVSINPSNPPAVQVAPAAPVITPAAPTPPPAAAPIITEPTAAPAVTIRTAPTTPNPASAVHSRVSIPARSNVLDLRSTSTPAETTTPIITPAQPAAPTPPPAPAAIKPSITAPSSSAPRPNTMDLSSRPASITSQAADTKRLDAASAVPQSNLIQKFHGGAAVTTSESATLAPKHMPGTAPSASGMTAAASPTVTSGASQTVNTLNDLRSSLPSQSVQAPAPQAAPTPAPQLAPVPAQPAPVSASFSPTPVNQPAAALPSLPNHVASQIDSMKSMTPIAAPATGKEIAPPKPKAALKPAIQPASLVAAAFAVIIMGGYIWINNYPKMNIRVAAGKAGFEATLPSYVPSGFSVGSNITYAPGQVTIPLASANRDQNLNVIERRTSWDAASLLDNFVSRQGDEYTSVPGQGLTIYLYGENQASWVNHGIWYTLEGNHLLGRDQLLKLAYSL